MKPNWNLIRLRFRFQFKILVRIRANYANEHMQSTWIPSVNWIWHSMSDFYTLFHYDWISIGIFHLNSKSQTKRKCVFFRFSFLFNLRRSHQNRNLIIMSRVISKEIDLIAWQRTTGNPFFTWNMSGGSHLEYSVN